MKSFVLFLFFIGVFSQNSSKVLPRIYNEKHYQEILTKNVKASIVYAYSSSNKCDECLKDIESIYTNMEGMVQAYMLYCEENTDIRQDLEICINFKNKAATLPEISFIEPIATDKYNRHILKAAEATFKFIKAFAAKMAPTYSLSLKTFQDLQDFLKDSKHGFNKVLFFYKTPEIPMLFKGLTAEYKDRLQFAHINYRNKDVMDHYGIQEFPTLLLLKRNIAKENDFFKFEFRNKFNLTNLVKFLNKYAFPQKVKIHATPTSQEVKNYLFKYDEFETEWESIQEKNFNNSLGFDQFKQEKVTLLHVTSSKVPFPLYSQLIERLSNSVNYVSLNTSRKSENIIFAEKSLKIKLYPALLVYYYNGTVLTNLTIPINQSFNEGLRIISDLIPDKSNMVNSEDNMEFYITKAFDEEKIAVVLFHDSDVISVSFRTFGHLNKYKNHFRFLNFKNPSESLKNKYGIKKLPKILAIVPQSFINSEGGTLVVPYEGVFIYHEMAKFVHHVLIKYKGDDLSNLVINLENQRMFEDLCLSDRYLFCLIGFFDINDKNLNQLKKYMEVFKRIKKQFRQINFHTLWVNVTCHKDIVKPFNLADKKLPQAVLYNQLNSKFSNHKKDFTFEHLTGFVMNLIKNPNELSYYDGRSSNFRVLNDKCDDQKEKVRRKDEL